MNSKPLIWIGVFVGSTAGSLIPMLWHTDIFSWSSILGSFIGGILGIWVGFKLGQNF